MPEGPETKRMADIIFKNLVGFKIVSSKFLHHSLFELKKEKNIYLKNVFSKGKAVIIQLNNDKSIITHNQLYGKWTSHFLNTIIKHKRVLRIEFCTQKKAVRLWSATDISLYKTSEEKHHPYLKKIGPDVLDFRTTIQLIFERLTSSQFKNKNLGSILLNQSFISGLGNYLRSEILFFSKTNHTQKASSLKLKTNENLAFHIKNVSQRAYKRRGVTLDLEHIEKSFGNIKNFKRIKHMVFRRDSLPCFICGSIILKVLVSSRAIFLCPSCQGFKSN